ncbi:hypothetical protein C5167_023401, partial [Papaver somniferum]
VHTAKDLSLFPSSEKLHRMDARALRKKDLGILWVVTKFMVVSIIYHIAEKVMANMRGVVARGNSCEKGRQKYGSFEEHSNQDHQMDVSTTPSHVGNIDC